VVSKEAKRKKAFQARQRISKEVETKWRSLSPKARDAWVAKLVMGSKTAKGDVPRYSSDVAAAWQIVRHFQRKGKSVELFVHAQGASEVTISTPVLRKEPPGCIFYDQIGNSFRKTSVAASICLAGLKAKGGAK
jgi:hypothetical protein